MLVLLTILGAVVVLCFGFVVMFGAPYLPTLTSQMNTAFEFLDLKPGQTLLELGCGDGKVLVAAAERGICVVGYEINPLLLLLCWLRTRRYKGLVRLRLANFWRADWPQADAVYGFILPRLMAKLDQKIIREHRAPLKVVSFAFPIAHKEPVQERDGIYLYEYK
jgi:SAM-dependent methyltransferase